MLKSLMGKGKDKKASSSSPDAENQSKRPKRAASKYCPGGSSAPHEQGRRSSVSTTPRAQSEIQPWSVRFFTEQRAERYEQIKSFAFNQEKGFSYELLKNVPEIYDQLRIRRWEKLNEIVMKEQGPKNATLVREFFANAGKAVDNGFRVYVRGKIVDYSTVVLNEFLGALVPEERCAFRTEKDRVATMLEPERRVIRDFVALPGTPWYKASADSVPTKIQLTCFKPMARAWAEFFVKNIFSVSNSSEYQIDNAAAVKIIMEGVPVYSEDETMVPIRALPLRAFQGFGRVVRGAPIPRVERIEVGEELEEMNQFEQGVHPDQNQPMPEPQIQHSEYELSQLLTQLDLNMAARLPYHYYNTQSSMYTQAMSYKQQFPPQPFCPYYPTWESWQQHLVDERDALAHSQAVNTITWREQFEAIERQRRASENAPTSSMQPHFSIDDFDLNDATFDAAFGVACELTIETTWVNLGVITQPAPVTKDGIPDTLRPGANVLRFWRVGAAGMAYIRKSQIFDPGSAVGDEN
ncbi:hypothetical protein TSUD_85380 [Trifolium subterraneum]|uniref:Putative plant transposon protein domain-containing protein n=1 Tax=Trifolium subterraneum TaxID=3900 RepID=A0A2Z6NRX2_TRISU|nr:hypothetical protein TSUD_85380 [Trifolium subterraneum]